MNLHELAERFEAHIPDMAPICAQRILESGMATYKPLTKEQLVGGIVAPGYKEVAADLREGSTHRLAAHYGRLGLIRAQQGGQIDDVLRAIKIAAEVMGEYVEQEFQPPPEQLLSFLKWRAGLVSDAMIAVSANFVEGREEIIRSQESQIREISTPIIPIHSGVLVLPVIGAIDSRRIGQIMEGLLEGIDRNKADAVIMDITGVPVVDTGVANYLLQAARAARLLGSQVVLVGISPEIAQTIVQLGVDLSDIVTRADLQSGVEYALGLQGLAIGERS
ncbi:MAG TPA: STAS domain-containing protein [Herpetosiphonaceae bacterium]